MCEGNRAPDARTPSPTPTHWMRPARRFRQPRSGRCWSTWIATPRSAPASPRGHGATSQLGRDPAGDGPRGPTQPGGPSGDASPLWRAAGPSVWRLATDKRIVKDRARRQRAAQSVGRQATEELRGHASRHEHLVADRPLLTFQTGDRLLGPQQLPRSGTVGRRACPFPHG